MRITCTVAGHTFRAEFPEGYSRIPDLSQYSPFVVAEGESEPLFVLEVVEKLTVSDPQIVLDQQTEPGETKIRLYSCREGWYSECSPTSEHPVAARLVLSGDFSRGWLEVTPEGDSLFAVNNSLMLQYAFRTATMGTLEMHASVIVNNGHGYLFTAKSGTGKSTQSRMWLRAVEGSRLLNDDNPVVRLMEDGRIRVFGTPWSGKTPCYRNESAPVGAFVQIRRCSENKATRLGIAQSYANLYSSCSGFKADRTIGDGLHSTLAACVTSVPCFVLDCLPDEDAARVCFNAVNNIKL